MKIRYFICAAIVTIFAGAADISPAQAELPDCNVVLKAGIQEKGCVLKIKQVVKPDETAAIDAASQEPSAAPADQVVPSGAVIVPAPQGTQPLGVMKEKITKKQAAQITATMIQGKEQMDIDRQIAAARAELAVRASKPVNAQPEQAATLHEIESSFGLYRESVCKVAANYDQCFADLTSAHVRRLNDFYVSAKK